MKELSIEEKARRYDEAIERAKCYKGHDVKCAMEYVFPELKESEDEKIRKELIDFLRFINKNGFVDDFSELNYTLWIAWLEKQGEQKSVIEMKSAEESLGIDSDTYNKIVDECIYGEHNPAWSEEDAVMLDQLLAVVKLYYDYNGNDLDKQSCISFLKSLKGRMQPQPKQEWSEEDEQAIEDTETWLNILCDYFKDNSPECIPTVKNVISKLKSLRLK